MRMTVLFMTAFLVVPACCTGDDVIMRIRERYTAIQDYQCRLDEFCTKDTKEERRIINFYFKKPKMIRMDILEGNRAFDSGSVGVYTGADTVRGHRGGILKGVVLTLSKHSTLATTIRGVSFDESDLETVIRRLEYYTENGTVRIEEDGSLYKLTCVPADASLNEGISKDIVWIDREDLLIRKNERYESDSRNGTFLLVQSAVWTRFILNAGLPDELFNVHFEVESLRDRNIPLISQELD